MSKRAPLSSLMSQMNASAAEPAKAVPDVTPENRRKEEKPATRILRAERTRRQVERKSEGQGSETDLSEIQRKERATYYLPWDVREMLLDESFRRKKAKHQQWAQQEILAEAVRAYLGGK
jgi:transcriptional regulator of met regulon